MGYIVLPKQKEAIDSLLQQPQYINYDSLELLWLPGIIHLAIWTGQGQCIQYLVDEDGGIRGI